MAIFQRSRRPTPHADDASGPDDVSNDVDARAQASPEAAVATGPETHENLADQQEHRDDDPADSSAHSSADAPAEPARPRRRFADAAPITLFQAAHPKQAVLTAVVVAGAAAASGRAAREVAVVLMTVLVGQAILGWHNDVSDRERDAAHGTPGKPVAQGRLDSGTLWYALLIAMLLVIPLSLTTGVTAGVYYLVSLIIGLLANVALRQGRFSWLPWATTFALYPFYLSYGGWGGSAQGASPQVAMVVLAALLGVGVHVLRSLWGLVADDADGWTYYPLKLGKRLGTNRLLVLAVSWIVVVSAGMVTVGATVGLRR